MFSGSEEIDFPQFRSFCRYESHVVSSSPISFSIQLHFFPVELLPQVEMFSSLQTMFTKAFSPKLWESNLTERFIILHPLSQALKHPNNYETLIGRGLLDTQPCLFTRSAVSLAPKDQRIMGHVEMANTRIIHYECVCVKVSFFLSTPPAYQY